MLESRVLFHDGVALHFAFALPTTPIDEPYNKDSGAVFSAQDDGVVYGWSPPPPGPDPPTERAHPARSRTAAGDKPASDPSNP